MTSTTLTDLATGKKPPSPLATLSSNLEKLKGQMAMALPKHMTADRMTRLALTAFSTTPALQQCTMQSIAGSLMTAAQMGLEPGVNGQGYLVPYKDRKSGEMRCQFIPGWRGLIDLVARAGRATAWTGAAYRDDGDDFDYQLGDAPYCRHRPADALPEHAQWTHVYAIGRVNGSQMPVIEVWSRAKAERHLRQYNKVGDRHYAKENANNFEMYARKVALLQVIKYLPQSVELAQAVMVADAADTGGSAVIDVQGMVVTSPPDIDPDTGEIANATQPAQGAADKPSAANAKTAEGPNYAQLADQLVRATSDETAALVLDAARHLPAEQYADLVKLYESKFPA